MTERTRMLKGCTKCYTSDLLDSFRNLQVGDHISKKGENSAMIIKGRCVKYKYTHHAIVNEVKASTIKDNGKSADIEVYHVMPNDNNSDRSVVKKEIISLNIDRDQVKKISYRGETIKGDDVVDRTKSVYEYIQRLIEEPKIDTTEEPKIDTIEEPKINTIEEPKIDTIEEPKMDTIEESNMDTIEKSHMDTIEESSIYSIVESNMDTIEESNMDTSIASSFRMVENVPQLESSFHERSQEVMSSTTLSVYTYRSNEQGIDREVGTSYNENYNLISNNCEHFAHYCSIGIKKSRQVGNASKCCRYSCESCCYSTPKLLRFLLKVLILSTDDFMRNVYIGAIALIVLLIAYFILVILLNNDCLFYVPYSVKECLNLQRSYPACFDFEVCCMLKSRSRNCCECCQLQDNEVDLGEYCIRRLQKIRWIRFFVILVFQAIGYVALVFMIKHDVGNSCIIGISLGISCYTMIMYLVLPGIIYNCCCKRQNTTSNI